MTENDIRKEVANVAMSYIGAKEVDGSHKPIIDIYNQISPLPRNYKMKYSDPWCATFVSVVSHLCGCLSIMPAECSCPMMISKYKDIGSWMANDAYDAKIGDVVFYDWDDDGVGDNIGASDHVGIIVNKNSSEFTVVEGNMSDSVGTRKLKKNGKYIRGFGLPDYKSLATEKGEETPKERIYSSVSLPDLYYGDGLNNPNPTVQAMQNMLIGRHYSCGGAGADGEFGNGTLAGVKNYQTTNGLPVTGEVDAAMWKSLLGIK